MKLFVGAFSNSDIGPNWKSCFLILDYEYETDNRSVDLPNDKQDFNRIQSWLDTASTSASEFDEYLRFEEALTNLRNQSNSNNYKTFSPHLLEQHAPKIVFQNEKLTRYNSCDNLKMRFDNILNRKKFYASSDVLNAPKVDNKNYKSQLNHSEIEKDREDRTEMNFRHFQLPHELEQYLIMNKNAKRHAIIENDKRNKTNVEYSLENYIKNYFDNEFGRQEIQSDAHSISGQASKVHSNLGQVTNDFTQQIAEREIDLNDGLIEGKKLTPGIDVEATSNETETKNRISYEATPVEIQTPENDDLISLKPDQLHLIQNSPFLTLQNNSESYAAAVKPMETEWRQTFDLEEKFGTPVETITKNSEDGVEAKNSSTNVIENTQTAEDTPQHPKLEPHREHEKDGKSSRNSTKDTREKIKHDFIKENGLSETEEILPEYFEEKILTDKFHEWKKSEYIAADQQNEAAIPENFSVFRQNLNHLTHVESGDSQQPEEFEKSNIPNMISKQHSKKTIFNSSDSFLPTELKTVSLSHDLEEETENAILLPELNALYWLAKCHLDFHIIEMKDAPLHTSTISKTYINDALENQKFRKSSEQNLKNKMNEIENSNKIESFSLSQNENEVVDTAEGSPIRKNAENPAYGITSAATEIEENEYFLFDQEKSEKYVNQDEAGKSAKSLATLMTEGSVRALAEKEQVQEFANQYRNSSNVTNEINVNIENDLVVSNKKLANPKNQNKIASTIHIILVNEKDEYTFSDTKNSDPSDIISHTMDINSVTEQNESILMFKETVTSPSNHNKITDNTTDVNLVNQQNLVTDNTTDMKPTDQQNGNPLSVEENIENLSKQNEITNDSEAVTLNKEEESHRSDKEKVENSVSQSTISSIIEVLIDENVTILLDPKKENIEETQGSSMSTVESVHESEDSEGSTNDENEKSLINEKISIENCENFISEDSPPSENRIEAEILQISKHQLIFKPTTTPGKEENRSELMTTLKVEDNNSAKVYKKTKKNLKSKKVSEISHSSENQNEKQNRAAANVTSRRTTVNEDLESQHSENDSNETREIQLLVENEELHQSRDSVPINQLLENSATILENGTSELSDPHLHFQPSIAENAKEEPTEIINEQDSRSQNEDPHTSKLEVSLIFSSRCVIYQQLNSRNTKL